MAGYYRQSMSNNAVAAYDAGERPLSRWTRDAILNRCEDKAKMLSSLTRDELIGLFLAETVRHHTSKYYNYTMFYKFKKYVLAEINEDTVRKIIESRPPCKRRQKKASQREL